MRQRSAFDQTAPHFSLPQRPTIVPSTQADALESLPAKLRKDVSPWPDEDASDDEEWEDDPRPSRLRQPVTSVALVKRITLPTMVMARPLADPDAPSITDLSLIPATKPIPAVGGSYRPTPLGPASRITFRKLVLFGAVCFAVFATTLATAGGGPVMNLVFSALHMNTTSTAAASQAGGPITQRVHAIIQADSNAGYDSQAQHDAWWDSTCSAASFTEVAHAWGISNVTIGQVVDRLVAHDPPYITTYGGLMSQDGWPWMASAYHLKAQVAWHAFTFDTLIQQVNSTGIPIIIGMKGGNTADPWGHFVVIVGGDSTQAQIVDSSLWKMHSLPRSFFSEPTPGIINDPIWWSGETIILTPQ